MRTLLIGLAVASTPAAADYTTVAPVRPLTLSDPAGLTSIAVELQLAKWTEHPPGLDVDYTSVTFDIAADIRLAPHWVLLARLPLSHVSVDGDPALADCCALALGNLTVGGRGLWSSVLGGGARSVLGGELALSLPTASDSGDCGVSAAASAFANLPHEPGRYGPNTTTLRFMGMGQYYSRWFLVDGEAGLQAFFFDDDVPGDSSDLGIKVALAIGVRATYRVAILAELNSLFASDTIGGDDGTATSIDLGVRYASQRLILGARLYLPLDAPLRDVDLFGFGLDAGARF